MGPINNFSVPGWEKPHADSQQEGTQIYLYISRSKSGLSLVIVVNVADMAHLKKKKSTFELE